MAISSRITARSVSTSAAAISDEVIRSPSTSTTSGRSASSTLAERHVTGRGVTGRPAVGAAGRSPVAVPALAAVARSPVATVPAGRPVAAALGGLLALRPYLVQVDLAALVDVRDLYLDLVADVEEVLDLVDPLAVAHLRDVQQAVPTGQQRD